MIQEPASTGMWLWVAAIAIVAALALMLIPQAHSGHAGALAGDAARPVHRIDRAASLVGALWPSVTRFARPMFRSVTRPSSAHHPSGSAKSSAYCAAVAVLTVAGLHHSLRSSIVLEGSR